MKIHTILEKNHLLHSSASHYLKTGDIVCFSANKHLHVQVVSEPAMRTNAQRLKTLDKDGGDAHDSTTRTFSGTEV